MNHKIISGCLIALCVPFICAAVLFGGIKWRTNYAKTEILTSSSEVGDYRLCIYMIGEPDWPFGETHCRFELFDNDKKIIKYDFSIRDDGAVARENNFDVIWNIDYVTVVVSGSEQEDKAYVLNYDGTVE